MKLQFSFLHLSLFFPALLFGENRSPDGTMPQGHASIRAGAEVGYQETLGSFVAPNFRFGLHDFLDLRTGYPENTQLDIFSARLRIHTSNPRLWIDELTAVRVVSLPPFLTEGERAWKIDLGLRTVREKICNYCTAGQLKAGLGYSGKLFVSLPVSFYVLAAGAVSVGPKFYGAAVKPAIGPVAGARLLESAAFTALIEASYHYQFFSDFADIYDFAAEGRWSPSLACSFSLRTHRYMDGWETAAGAYFYF